MDQILKDNYLVIIIVLSIVIVILLVLFLFDIYFIRRLSKDNKQLIREIDELKNKLQVLSKKQNKNTANREPSTNILQQNISGQQGKQILENNHCISSDDKPITEIKFKENIEQTPIYNYLQEAHSGKFIKMLQSPDRCFFRTWTEGNTRKFEFYGNVSKALANINAIFDDVCDIEGKRSGATVIENVKAGTLDLELRITNKALIRLK
jgi:hypothetical protein